MGGWKLLLEFLCHLPKLSAELLEGSIWNKKCAFTSTEAAIISYMIGSAYTDLTLFQHP